MATVLIAFALAVLAFYLTVHVSLVFHGRSVVAAAAQDALAAAKLEDGTINDGYAAAHRTLSLSPGLRDVQVNVQYEAGDTRVRVTVSASVETVLVEMRNDVSATVVGPREQFIPEDERR